MHKKLFQKLSDNIHSENYLYEISNPDIRHTVTKFRLSNHKLNLEMSTHKNIPKELCFCPFCINTIETEIHFLLECPSYNILRSELVDKIIFMKPNYIFNSQTENLQYLLSLYKHRGIIQILKRIMDIREFLIDHPIMYC